MKAFNRPTGQHTRAARSFTCARVSQGRSLASFQPREKVPPHLRCQLRAQQDAER